VGPITSTSRGSCRVSSAVSSSVMPPQICRSAGLALRHARGKTASRGCSGASGKRLATRKTSTIRAAARTEIPVRRGHRAAGREGAGAGTASGSGAGAGMEIPWPLVSRRAWTGGRKRYPRRGRVSTYRGAVAESSRARRICLMQKLRPASKSTNDSPQTSSRISSRLTTSPERRASSSSTRAGWGWSVATGEPARSSSPLSSRSSKSPNRRAATGGSSCASRIPTSP
jgi:hypothetical protein